MILVLLVLGMAWQGVRSPIDRPNALGRVASRIDGSQLRVFELIGTTERTTRCWADVQAVHQCSVRLGSRHGLASARRQAGTTPFTAHASAA